VSNIAAGNNDIIDLPRRELQSREDRVNFSGTCRIELTKA